MWLLLWLDCLVPMSWGEKWQPQNCNAFEKILLFLSVSFDAGTSTKGKYDELSVLACQPLCKIFFGRKPSCLSALLLLSTDHLHFLM